MASDAGSAGTDLGRRIAEERGRVGLSVKEAAERAGMSPEYLAYIETSQAPNPTQGALTRLAAALGVPPGALTGAGLNQPPGDRQAAQKAVLADMNPAECREHIAAGGVGRFLFVNEARGPVALPVNYRMQGDDVVFRTSDEGSVTAGVRQPQVSFDIDHLDDTLAEGWSVLLSGKASIITDQGERAEASKLGIEPWAGGDRDTYVRMTPAMITGRTIRVTA
jgi:nitroimidazol reductase NimA-like FMN-containing flavoprotein (pyridoxamine 5'-phosphate oxidase superfamily)